MNNTDGFKRGSGQYTCVECGKQTRKVKYQDSDEMCMLCEQKCYLENMENDGAETESIEAQKQYIKELEDKEKRGN